jgi:hypothetical protein
MKASWPPGAELIPAVHGKEIENQYLSPNENPITARAGLVVPF